MGAPDEVLQMLLEGLSPGEIRQAREKAGKGSSVNTILPYIDSLIGSGRIRRSDVLFTIKLPARRVIAEALGPARQASDDHVTRSLLASGIAADRADIAAVRRYGDARFSLGDMYDDIVKGETQLHNAVWRVLESAHQDQWWTLGVPPRVQRDCENRAQRALPGPELYRYTTILDLHAVIKNQPDLFAGRLAAWNQADLKTLLRDLQRLNRIRNVIMHPVRGEHPTDEDFEFTKMFARHPGVG